MAFCKNNNITGTGTGTGTGTNLEVASKITGLETPEGRVALINIAENEWASADENSAGANGMNIIKDTMKIQQAKKENDFVFVIIHGGHEYYNLPSPRMQEQYRFYAEQGADLVVGHHTHCISGYEIYNETHIYYSLGNFLFTKSSVHEEWYKGLVLEVNLDNGKLETVLHPIKQEKSFNISLLKGKEKDATLLRIEDYRRVIESKDQLQKEWTVFLLSKRNSYLSYWSPKVFIKNRYIAAGLNRMKIKLTSTQGLAYYLNLMRCEAHYDLSKGILDKELKK